MYLMTHLSTYWNKNKDPVGTEKNKPVVQGLLSRGVRSVVLALDDIAIRGLNGTRTNWECKKCTTFFR